MQLSGRPLLDNATDHALFVGREQILQKLDRLLRSGLNCLVVGQPGSGKTSLVRALMFRSDQGASPLRVVFVRANRAASATDVLMLVRQSLQSGQPEPAPLPTAPMPVELIDRIAEDVRERGPADLATRVIVVEDITATAGIALFGGLRDELWQVDAQWLVTTSTAHAPGLLRAPADAFFETTIELGPLTTDEAAELLRRRLPDPVLARVLPGVAEAARETPRRLLEVVRELTAEGTVGGQLLNIGRGLELRAAALAGLSRPARMLAQELEALGWASASDERLLTRLGWTRPRVVQVMAELERRGLVDMREENTGRGRPRKLYRLKPPGEFVDPGATEPPVDPVSP